MLTISIAPAKLTALPRGQSLSGGAKPLCTSVRREQARRGRSARPRRPGELFQRDMRQLVFTWSIKCRISEQAEAVRFDECSGPANQSDDWCTHDHSR